MATALRENFDKHIIPPLIVQNRLQNAQKGYPTRPQPRLTPQAYPLGYVEDVGKVRTQLGDFFSILPGERVMTAVMLSRLKEIQQKGIDDIGPLPHGDVTGVGNKAESRARYGTVKFLTYQRGKHRILLAPED
jgi:hypothetical protein